MKDNGYLEQATALLNKAKEADEVMGVILVTSGRKKGFQVLGSGAAVINTLIELQGQSNDFDAMLVITVASWIASTEEFAANLGTLLSDPEKLKDLLKKASDKLDAEIKEINARREASGDGTEKEESHDSEEAA